MSFVEKVAQFPFQPSVYKVLTVASGVSSILLGAQMMRDFKSTDKKLWYLGLASTAIAAAIIFYGYKKEKK
jgi:hypothetical protein